MEGGAPHVCGVQRPLAQALERPGVSGPFLQDELETLEACVVLESTRLGKDVTFTHHMHPAVPSCAQIPALLLQPALENALWHGFDDSVDAPQVHLTVTPMNGREGWLVLTLLDNGIGLCADADTGSSEGLQLVREKVLTMAQEANVFFGTAAEPWSTMARITFPVLPANADAANERGRAASKSPRSPSLKSSHPTAATMAALSVQ